MDVRVIGHHDFKRPFVKPPEDAFKLLDDDAIGMIVFVGFVFLLIFAPYIR